jgi:hypothetical protein
MLFRSNSKVNKLVLLRRELYPMLSCLFKTALISLTKHSTVLFCALIISKKVKIINVTAKTKLKLRDTTRYDKEY